MLSTTLRLRRSRVEHVLKKGYRKTTNYFSIKFLRGAQSESRFAVVVSTKIEAKATDRNHLRRQIYEAINSAQKPSSPLDIVLIAKPTTKKLPFAELQEIVTSTLSQLHEENR